MNVIIEYCKENLALTFVLLLLFVFLFVVLGVILFLFSKAKKATSVSETPREEKSEPPLSQKERVERKIEGSYSIAKEEEIVVFEETEENESFVEDRKEAQEKEITVEKKAKVKKEEKTSSPTVKKTEKKETKPKNTQVKKESGEEKKTQPPAAKKTTVKKATKNTNEQKNKSKEANMLIDELKDVETAIDFYEEDETDQIARYRGKWVICRVITSDKTAAEDEMYFFELHASNGEKLISSEEYTTYNGALRGIETHKTNILRGNFKITLSKKGDYIFKLLSGKNLLLCMGENYLTRARCESAIESAKRFAKTAIIDENIQDHIVKVPPEDDGYIPPLPDGYNGKWIIDSRVGVDGERLYFFELFANNGEKLLSSEEYTTYIGAVNGIQTHKSNIAEGNFRVCLTKRGDYIYKLLNRNGQLLCLGEHYRTKQRCLNAVESVKRFAVNSPVLADSRITE